ncbi:MAG: hypothetical protein KME40_09125 [Komarekiella atlantica HA4396-MV6]|nr:hypothetical protein [Komarekiella atlantica HA4396-MV6]
MFYSYALALPAVAPASSVSASGSDGAPFNGAQNLPREERLQTFQDRHRIQTASSVMLRHQTSAVQFLGATNTAIAHKIKTNQ